MIDKKKLKDRLTKSVHFAKENGEYSDIASWPYQQGVLLDYKEAEYICSLLNDVGQSEQLICEHKYQDNVCDWRGVRKCIICGKMEKAN